MSLEAKIVFTHERIFQFASQCKDKIYVAFSGGKDSTVLLHLVRTCFPDCPAVFVNTRNEYPEVIDFVHTITNCTIIIPELTYFPVCDIYGYPVISKEVSKNISRFRGTTDPLQREYRLTGCKNGVKCGSVGVIPKKYHSLIDAPFKISDMCCDILKKKPMKLYEKRTGNRPIIGTMATDSYRRAQSYRVSGCNNFTLGEERSTPMGFWTEKDVWDYIKMFNLSYSKIYDMGENRTGCMFCLFGCHLEEEPNRIQRMYYYHPKLYWYYISKMKPILDFMMIPYHYRPTLGWDWDRIVPMDCPKNCPTRPRTRIMVGEIE